MTRKQHYNMIVRKAATINRHLNILQNECKLVADMCREHADEYDYDDWLYLLSNLNETLEDLINFDLEDSLPTKED